MTSQVTINTSGSDDIVGSFSAVTSKVTTNTTVSDDTLRSYSAVISPVTINTAVLTTHHCTDNTPLY